jgi:hypothetical protein
MRYMRFLVAIVLLALLSGCIGAGDEPGTTTLTTQSSTTTLQDDFTYITPPTDLTPSTDTTSTSTTQQNPSVPDTYPTSTTLSGLIRTFIDHGGENCLEDGKPVIRMYSKPECEHCQWSGPIFDKVAREYADKGLITAHHWVFDANDDALTIDVEKQIPAQEYDIFFRYNTTTVPYFSFGCRFTRVGNGYQIQKQPQKEEAEYRALIEQLLNNV